MPLKNHPFYNNHLYQLFSNQFISSNERLQQLNSLLHKEPALAELIHPKEGSYFHIVCRNFNDREK